MKRRILKYPLTETVTVLELPRGSRLLSFQDQRGTPTVWALVSDREETERVELQTFPTGATVPDGYWYFGTILMYDGNFVLHLFYKNLAD